MIWRVRAIAVLFALPLLAACPEKPDLRSPDGRVAVYLRHQHDKALAYAIDYHGRPIVGTSMLGLEIAGGLTMVGAPFGCVERVSRDQTWEQPWGERRFVRDHYNELFVCLGDVDGDPLGLRIRAFDDGVGFRYELGGTGDVEITRERTEINLAGPATAWWQPSDGKLRYEHLYRNTPLADMDGAHTPVTIVREDGIHVAVHEAALIDYSAYSLVPDGSGFGTELRPWSDGIAVRSARPLVTPWRTIQVSPDASGLINSDLILNLNEPNRLGDVSWVRPGKYVGIWWEMHLGLKTWEAGPRHGATTEHARRYIDFAAENGFDGVLIEGWNKGWHGPFNYLEAYDDFNLETVAEYASERGVYLIGHHETYGDVPAYEDQMAAGFDVLAAAGVPQVKTGYVADAGRLRRIDAEGNERLEWHDGQYHVEHLLRNLRVAAERRIAINTHEPVKDTGLRRTWPNWLTREGSRGQEFAIWGETPNPPEHTVVLAHTRMLGGPMDFTPGMFDLHPERDGRPRRIQTTLAKQLALYVVLYSPMQMVPDLPENYAARPDAFEFIRDVPVDWEDSVALAGEVGDYVVVARRERDGDDWYLGAITDEEARTVRVPLGILDAGVTYTAEVYRDGDDAHWDRNPYDIEIERRSVDNETELELQLAAGGGTAVRFRPQEKSDEE